MIAYVSGAHATAFGRQPGRTSLDWQAAAALAALDDAGLTAGQVDAMLVGYSTTLGHLMPANVLAERLGATPRIAQGMSVGGATGLAMVAQAARLAGTGEAHHVLVVAGEDRASGQTSVESTRVLAQVGHEAYEVPLGATVPAYYGLLASRYLWSHALPSAALAPLAVQMREHAARTPGAHFQTLITKGSVTSSRPVAEPLRLLDCCPISDGGAAFVVSTRPQSTRSIRIEGIGSANRHQHLSSLAPGDTGARRAATSAMNEARVALADIDVFGIYDSFTITLALILEELGLAPEGGAGDSADAGVYGVEGRYPTNTHGGLLSYGQCGVAGGMAHLAEVVTQLRGERTAAQVADCRLGYVHAEGGVLSAHVGLVLGRLG